jgi:hypothetical protein
MSHASLSDVSMNDANGNIAINLSLVGVKPTGLATYAKNLIPHLGLPNLTLLAPTTFPRLPDLANYSRREIPANLTAEQGKAAPRNAIAAIVFARARSAFVESSAIDRGST